MVTVTKGTKLDKLIEPSLTPELSNNKVNNDENSRKIKELEAQILRLKKGKLYKKR